MKKRLGLILLVLVLFSCSVISASNYQVWVATNLEKFLRDQPSLSALPEPELELKAAKNEWEGGQVIITANETSLNNITVTVGDLIHEDGNTKISGEQVKLYKQHYIETKKQTTNAFPVGWYPDALIPLEVAGEINIGKGNNQGFYISLKVPKGQKPGQYSSRIVLDVGGKITTVPFKLTVWDFELTDESHGHTAFAIWNGQVADYHGVKIGTDEYWALMNNYYWFQTEYRLPPDDLPIPVGDVKRYLKDAESYLSNPKVSSFRIPYFSNNPLKNKQMVDELRALGWLDKGYYYLGHLIDEPSPEQYPLVKRYCTELKRVAPDARHVVTIRIVDDLLDYVDTWCPLYSQYDEDFTKERKEARDHIWWYGCVAPKHPYPTYHLDDHLISARMVSWMQKAYDIEGNLYWATTIFHKYDGSKYIPRDVWNDPAAFPNANGDGYLLYPGKDYGIDGPIATMRIETIRDGMEDFEYLWVLEQRLNCFADKFGIKEEFDAKKVIQPFYDKLFEDPKTYNADPKNLFNVREEIAQEILEINERPYVLVTQEKVTHEGESQLNIYVEPGTSIMVNGEPLTSVYNDDKVNKYIANLTFQLGENKVSVLADDTKGQKEIERTIFVYPPGGKEAVGYETEICYFERENDLERWRPTNVEISIVDDYATQGEKALKAVYQPGVEFPNIKLMDEGIGFRSSDWSGYKALAFDVYNPTERTASFYCKFFSNDYKSDDNNGITIRAGRKETVVIPLKLITLDLTIMKGFELWMFKQAEPFTIYYDNFRFISDEQMPSMIPSSTEEKLGPELVTNGGFEELDAEGMPKSWKVDKTGKSKVEVTGKAYSGRNAILIIREDDPESYWVGIGQRIKVEPNSTYRLNAQAMANIVVEDLPVIGAYFYNSNGDNVGSSWPIQMRYTAEYDYYTANLVTGKDVSEIELRCESYSKKGVKFRGNIWVDDISLRKVE